MVGGGDGGERRADDDARGNWTADDAKFALSGNSRCWRGPVPLAARPGTSARPTPLENAGRTLGSCHASEFAVSAIRYCCRGSRLARRRLRAPEAVAVTDSDSIFS